MCYRIVSSLTRESTVCYPAIVVVDYEAGYHLDAHWCSTNAARANDLNVHASYRAAWFCGNHRKRGRYFGLYAFLDRGKLALSTLCSIIRKFRGVDVATVFRQLSKAPGGASSCDECVESAERQRIQWCARAHNPATFTGVVAGDSGCHLVEPCNRHYCRRRFTKRPSSLVAAVAILRGATPVTTHALRTQLPNMHRFTPDMQ